MIICIVEKCVPYPVAGFVCVLGWNRSHNDIFLTFANTKGVLCLGEDWRLVHIFNGDEDLCTTPEVGIVRRLDNMLLKFYCKIVARLHLIVEFLLDEKLV